MKNELIQLASYLESLEQRIGKLESIIADNQEAEKAQEEKIAQLEQTIQSQAERIVALEERPIVGESNEEEEPEIEVELVVNEEENEEEPIVQENNTDEKEESVVDKIASHIKSAVPSLFDQVGEENSPIEQEPEIETESEPKQEQEEKKEPEQPHISTPTISNLGQPVDDIRRAIPIGDRFLFQRELFGSNGEAMQKTLDEINKLNTLDEAINYINQLGWDKKSSTFELFMNVLRRRFNV